MADSDDNPKKFTELLKKRILSGSVSQYSYPFNVQPYPCMFESDAKSSLSKRRQGMHSSNDCSICSLFFYRRSTNCHFIDDKNILW